jgi:hypothetical protein|tara:strand:+ start:193 stop:543 length:351 start_codon:yes stop_codon:yes gene_type:complete
MPYDKRKKRNKYNNKRTKDSVTGIVFDSHKEARHSLRLKDRELNGEISSLKLQVKFSLEVNDCKVCDYVADFTYIDKDDNLVVEDVKSPQTSKNPVFRLKKKLMFAVYGIEIQEIM